MNKEEIINALEWLHKHYLLDSHIHRTLKGMVKSNNLKDVENWINKHFKKCYTTNRFVETSIHKEFIYIKPYAWIGIEERWCYKIDIGNIENKEEAIQHCKKMLEKDVKQLGNIKNYIESINGKIIIISLLQIEFCSCSIYFRN